MTRKTNIKQCEPNKQLQECEPNKENFVRETKDYRYFIQQVAKDNYKVWNCQDQLLCRNCTLREAKEFIDKQYV